MDQSATYSNNGAEAAQIFSSLIKQSMRHSREAPTGRDAFPAERRQNLSPRRSMHRVEGTARRKWRIARCPVARCSVFGWRRAARRLRQVAFRMRGRAGDVQKPPPVDVVRRDLLPPSAGGGARPAVR